MPTFYTHDRTARPIAFLDSGVGGIGVLREVKKLLPREQLLYFGDSLNAPYGEKSDTQIKHLVLCAADRLLQTAKALVLACNTATAVAAGSLRERYPHLPIIGMEPALHPAVAAGHRRILVLATQATLRTEKFLCLRQKCEKTATVLPLSAPGIVRLVEAGLWNSPEMEAYLRCLLAPYIGEIDAVVLGCTHFPFASVSLRRVLGELPFYDGAAGTAAELYAQLSRRQLLAAPDVKGGVLLLSNAPQAVPRLARLLTQP